MFFEIALKNVLLKFLETNLVECCKLELGVKKILIFILVTSNFGENFYVSFEWHLLMKNYFVFSSINPVKIRVCNIQSYITKLQWIPYVVNIGLILRQNLQK